MFYNYFRNAVLLRGRALHYTQDHTCSHHQYLLSPVEGSAHALTCHLRKKIAHYDYTPPRALDMALLTPRELQIPP